MAIKRNRLLIGGVLMVALAAFIAISIIPLLGTSANHNASTTATYPDDGSGDPQAELQRRADGYASVLEREPDNQTALRGLVETRIQLNDLTGVIDPLERLAELNPDIPDYAVLLGQTQQQLGDLESAARAYRTVLDISPGNMNALQGLVGLMMSQGRPQAAIGLLQDTLNDAAQANQVQPNAIDTTSVQLLLAQVYVEEGRVEEAIALYDQAIASRPEDFRPLLAKALVLRNQGQVDAAGPLFADAIALAPDQYKDQIQQLAQSETPQTGAPNSASPDPSANSEPANSEPTNSETIGENESPASSEADSAQ
ncbi:MAG: tetratricopeptide repeat protein [Cyanobacteria bacterium P01_H01_bin.119]